MLTPRLYLKDITQPPSFWGLMLGRSDQKVFAAVLKGSDSGMGDNSAAIENYFGIPSCKVE